jgi:hypothetical protein
LKQCRIVVEAIPALNVDELHTANAIRNEYRWRLLSMVGIVLAR